MSKRFSILLVVLTIVSGLVGGAITGRIFTPKVAIAAEATPSKVLTVEELRIVDENGKVGAVMCVTEDGGNVKVLGKNGKGGAMMGVVNSSGTAGGVVSVHDGKSCAMMTINRYYTNESGGSVTVLDKNGKVRAVMCVNEHGNGVIGLLDKNGNKLK